MNEDEYLNMLLDEHFNDQQTKEEFEWDNADEFYESDRDEN